MNRIHYSIKGAFRIAQMARVLAQTGLGWILGDRPPAPRLLRKTFEQLGATYIKLGQFIASSPSLFPTEYVKEFEQCLDQTEPLPFAAIAEVMEQELGPLEAVFAEIDPKPLASASIAQVHAGRLMSGEDVAIKVQKPGVRDILLTDLNFLYISMKVLEFLRPGLSRASLSAIVSEIHKTMLEECDFIREADNLEQFQEFLQTVGNDQVRVPRVHHTVTTVRVLTMERLYGVPLTNLESIRKYSVNPEITLIMAMNTWFSSLLFCDFFHADMHGGNLMILEDGRIGFLDFGIVGRISPKAWRAVFSLLEAIGQMDYQGIAGALVDIGITQGGIDRAKLAEDLEYLFEQFTGLQPEEHALNQFILDIVALGKRYGLHFPREFTLLLKQFLYFDRYIQILAPDLDLYGDDRLKMLPALM